MQTIDSSLLMVKPLREKMDVSSFCSTDDELNEYLREEAAKDQKYLYSITKIVEYNGKIIGFFTLVTDTIKPKDLAEEIGKKYSYAKLPALKIARLATDKNYAGQGIGTFMMEHIFNIVLDLVEDVGCRVITVDAKSNAQGFYEHFGFEVVKSKGRYDIIPMYTDILPLVDMA